VGQAGTHSAAGVELSDWDTVAEGDQTQVLVEAWIPACAGMARKGNSRIVTMFVDANWVTASFRREDENRHIAVNEPYESEHWMAHKTMRSDNNLTLD
jgi:hypothetical protein